MSLGEAIDSARARHASNMEAVVNHVAERCDHCIGLSCIQTAYEEMMRGLVDVGPLGYESTLLRDPDYVKEENT